MKSKGNQVKETKVFSPPGLCLLILPFLFGNLVRV